MDLTSHDWVFCILGVLWGSVGLGQKVKIHKVTPTTGKERGDIEVKDYVVLPWTGQPSSSPIIDSGLYNDT